MVLMATASNLLVMYLGLEFVSITSYVLSGLIKRNRQSAEAALKYFVYGAAASGVMLFGFSYLYGLTGTLDVESIGRVLKSPGGAPSQVMMSVILVLVFAGFGYKVVAAPFHMWSPDVYEGAPTPVTAFFSVGPKAAGFAMLVRFAVSAIPWSPAGRDFEWRIIIAIVAMLTMTVGNLTALFQSNLKRLMAYSGIAHAGYMLLALTLCNQASITALLFYLAVYLIMNLGAFAVIILLEERYSIKTVEQCSGIGWFLPEVCVPMAIFLFSLTGLPPTAGFVGKLLIFGALIEHNDGLSIGLTVFGVLYSVVSLFYYARILMMMF
jgi:NADH-quinone oxidoreductase subunit N